MNRRPNLLRPLTLGVVLDSATDALPGSGCRLWTRSRDADGYGRISLDGRNVGVHRLVLAWSYGYELSEVPSHVVTRHRCRNRHCIEPSHLWAGYAAQNVADAIADGSMPWTFADGRCQRGHDVTVPANVALNAFGGRRCRRCQRDRRTAALPREVDT